MKDNGRRQPSTYKFLLAFVAIIFFLLTIFTYYKELSQYQTADQTLTLSRIQSFLSAPEKYDIAKGTNFSNIIIGEPGNWLAGTLSSHLNQNQYLFWGIHYNEIIPFSLIQVTISLIMIIVCVILSASIIGWKPKVDWSYYILLFDLVANLPVLKGEARVLKYDIFSIVLAVLALLSFILFKERKKKRFLISAAILGALSFIEKDVFFLAGIFILAYEACSISYTSPSVLDFFQKLLKSYLIFIVTFFATIFVFVPRFWHDPKQIIDPFVGLMVYIGSKELGLLFVGGAALLTLVAIFKTKIREFLSSRSKQMVYLFFVSAILLFLVSLLYQSNNMHVMNTQQIIDYVKMNHLFVGKEINGVEITTLDRGYFVTAIKIFFNEIRIVSYVLPEIFILILLLAPLLVLTKKNIFGLVGGSKIFSILLLFCAFFMFIGAASISPVEAKYLSVCLFLFALISGLIACQFIKELSLKSVMFSSIVVIALLILFAWPAIFSGPAYFGYMNSFRNIKYEDATKYKLSDDSFWTWVGWGEASYSVVKHLESEKIEGTVAFDYLPPFYQADRLKYENVFSQMQTITNEQDLNAALKDWREVKGVQYVVISKNMANRYFAPNYLMKKYRPEAIYIDTAANGVEYGWLFRIEELQR